MLLLLLLRSSRRIIDSRGYVGGAIRDVSNFVGARIGGAVDRPRDGDGGVVKLVQRRLLMVLMGEGFPGETGG